MLVSKMRVKTGEKIKDANGTMHSVIRPLHCMNGTLCLADSLVSPNYLISLPKPLANAFPHKSPQKSNVLLYLMYLDMQLGITICRIQDLVLNFLEQIQFPHCCRYFPHCHRHFPHCYSVPLLYMGTFPLMRKHSL